MNVEKLKQEIDRLRHELDLSERRHKQLWQHKRGGPRSSRTEHPGIVVVMIG